MLRLHAINAAACSTPTWPHSIEEDEAILEAHGVPLNALTENAEFLLAAAKETIDSSAVSLGCIFAAAGVRILRDDAIVPALRALNVTM